MLVKEMVYKDFEGVKRKETFCFNLTEAEILKMEWATSGGLANKLQKIMDKKDGVEVMRIFDEIIDAAYGVKSDDGRLFLKTPEALAEFKATQAYSDLYKKLCTDAEEAINFVNAIIPEAKDMPSEIDDSPLIYQGMEKQQLKPSAIELVAPHNNA